MPIVVPPFVQYTAPLIAVPCRVRSSPPEGDRMIPVEIDWRDAGAGRAVQIQITSFSPVEFSQICALSVDNSRSGADVDFIFPDTGKQLTVPAYAQGVFPIFTNSMTFYVAGVGSLAGDVSVFCILNHTPPPVAVLPTQEQSHALGGSLSLNTVNQVTIIPPPTTGTLQAFTLELNIQTGTTPPNQNAAVNIIDGTGNNLWSQGFNYPASTTTTLTIPVSGLKLRFANGLYLSCSVTTMPAGAATINVYYAVP